MNYIVIGFIIYLLLINAITTIRLVESDLFESTQKVFQTILIWFLPFFGAALIANFLNEEPLVLSKRASKYALILKFLLWPFMIKIKSNLDEYAGNSTEGYQVDYANFSGNES